MFFEIVCGVYNKIPTLHEAVEQHIKDIENDISKKFGFDEPNDFPLPEKINKIKTEVEKFKLPIHYLDSNDVFTLSTTVADDLELVSDKSRSMYEYLFQPDNDFALYLIPEWKKQYTTNTVFLNDTQEILKKMGDIKSDLENITSENCEYCDNDKLEPIHIDHAKFANIWDDLKNEDYFLEKYSYIDWDIFKQFNQSQSFLQFMSLINVVSPFLSLCMPLFLLVLPFVLLKIQRIPITFSIYIETLKDIAKNHFIGKSLSSMESFKFDKLFYFFFTVILYIIQIYQNVTTCCRFYKNMYFINDSLLEIRNYTVHSINTMDIFLQKTKEYTSYSGFHKKIEENREQLIRIYGLLKPVYEFKHTIGKFTESGYMLKCYYELYSNKEFETALSFSMGFHGYISNMTGVYSQFTRGNVSFAEFGKTPTKFIEQYYPPLIEENPVKNNCSLKKNIIISAPNKAGKTTILKTTTINIIFSQQIGCGFYSSATLKPYTHIHSYLNIPDTSGRDSLFQAESRRCKDIIDLIQANNDPEKYSHFCIFDELYSGTNPGEASKAGCAFLEYLSEFSNVNFMLTTHYMSICKKFKKSERIQNYKMQVNIMENGDFEYTYLLNKGISKIKGAIRVLKDMDYPKEIIDKIEKIN
jgi:hypothetical protein